MCSTVTDSDLVLKSSNSSLTERFLSLCLFRVRNSVIVQCLIIRMWLPCISDRAIRHRACDLRDTAYAIITTEIDPDFDKQCEDIKAARGRRGMCPLLACALFSQ